MTYSTWSQEFDWNQWVSRGCMVRRNSSEIAFVWRIPRDCWNSMGL